MQNSLVAIIAIVVLVFSTGCQETGPDTVLPLSTVSSLSPIIMSKLTHTTKSIDSTQCQIANLPFVNTTLSDLDHLAWSPAEDTLAYISPSADSDLALGDLSVVGENDFTSPQILASNVNGDPTWSPDGSMIGFVVFRPSDQLGSVVLYDLKEGQLRDLLPGTAAQTDAGTSYKGILGWFSEFGPLISTNCGVGCRRVHTLSSEHNSLDVLLQPEQEGIRYDWSPDLDKVVVTAGFRPQIGITSMNDTVNWLSGHNTVNEAWENVFTLFADWHPDSSQFLFYAQSNKDRALPELWTWDLTSNTGAKLLEGVISASWSPDGDTVAYVSIQDTLLLSGTPQMGIGLYQPQQEQSVVFEKINEIAPNSLYPDGWYLQYPLPLWSPSGDFVVFPHSNGISILSIGNTMIFQLPTEGSVKEARWSFSGTRLALGMSNKLQVFSISCLVQE